MSNNENLMESILAHLTKLILLTENGDEDSIKKLVNMACEVSNQIIKIENREYNYEESDQEDESDEDSEDDEYEEIEEE
jgi:hypothetical protein